jgi:hypothetical protein
MTLNGETGSGGFSVGTGDVGWIASTSSATATCTVTFTGTTGGARVVIYDIPVSGGTATVDAINSNLASSFGATFSSPALTLTGTTDVVLSIAFANANFGKTNITAATSCTNTNFDTTQTGMGACLEKNVTNYTAPTWTPASHSTPAGAVVTNIAFGFTPTPAFDYAITDMSGVTSGTVPTNTTMQASSFGFWSNGTIANFNPTWTISGTGCTASTSAHHALLNSPPRLLYSGVTYADSGSVGISCSTTPGANNNVKITAPTGGSVSSSVPYTGTVTSSCVDFQMSNPSTTTSTFADLFTTSGSTGYMNVLQGNPGGTQDQISTEVIPGGGSSTWNISPNTWYKLCESVTTTGNSQAAVYTDSGTVVSPGVFTSSGGASGGWIGYYFGIGAGTPATGQTLWFDKAVVCSQDTTTTCPFPLIL